MAVLAMSLPNPSAFGTFLTFEIRRALRNRRYVMLGMVFPVVFYLVYTNIVGNGVRHAVIDGIGWDTFFMVSMAAFGTVSASIGGAVLISRERGSGWTRQLRVTPLAPAAYAVGKVVVSYLVTLPALALVLGAGLVVDHVSLPAATWIELVLALVLGALPFAALGLLIGSLFDEGSAQGATTITMFGLSLLGGLWAPIQSFPDALATIGRVLPSYHLANLGWTILGGRPIDPADVAILVGYAVLIAGLAAWQYVAGERSANA